MDDYAKQYRLMCPGPVNVSQRVLRAMTAYEIGHREVEFSELLLQIQHHCLELMKLDPNEYRHGIWICRKRSHHHLGHSPHRQRPVARHGRVRATPWRYFVDLQPKYDDLCARLGDKTRFV